jgi:hypothetical protein
MSVQTFINDPQGYTKGHVVQFSHQAAATSPAACGMQVLRTFDNWGGAWTAEEYGPIANQFTNFKFEGDFKNGAHVQIGTGSKAMHTIECLTTGVDQGIRFLPWKANTVTFMQLGAGARTFFTGPLSGCSIFIGRSAAGAIWAFHANRNNNGAHNAGVKTSMLINTVGSLAAPVPIIHSCIYQQHYNNLGFVFGQIKSGQWRFYVADTSSQARGGGHFTTTVTRLT